MEQIDNNMNGFINVSMLSEQFQSPKDQFRPSFPYCPNQWNQQNGFHQQHQLQAMMLPPKLDNSNQFFPLPSFEHKTMIQVAQQFNQYNQPNQSSMNTPVKKKPNYDSVDDMFNSSIFKTPTKSVDPKIISLCQLQRVAVDGCEGSLKIYKNHSRRPYFKKIDLLCDRLKQDLSNTNKAVINVNSHGIAWAIKDFIFVFNRIISAWVIMRDYIYSSSEGMQCVMEAVDPSLADHFLAWQEETFKFAKCLMESCDNLNARDQRNLNQKNRSNSNQNLNFDYPSQSQTKDEFQQLFDSSIAENSEQAQLNGGYLKSAVYKPVSSSAESTPPQTPNSTHDYESFKMIFNELLPDCGFIGRNGNPKPLYKRGAESTPCLRSKMNLIDQFDSFSFKEAGIQPIPEEIEPEEVDIMKLSITVLFNMDSLLSSFGDAGMKKILRLLNDVMLMPEAISFLSPTEGSKFPHLPNLIINEEVLSLTQIIGNIQDNKYKSVRDVFIALKMVSEYAKALLTFYNQQNDKRDEEIIEKFVKGIESALARYA